MILFYILLVNFFIFLGIWIYGMKKIIKEKTFSKAMIVGVIGINICNVFIQLLY